MSEFTPIPILQLIDQPPEVVDRLLGPPETAAEITDFPKLMPGERRSYLLEGGARLRVRFFHGRALRFLLELDAAGEGGAATPEEAVARFGIDVSTLYVESRKRAAMSWVGRVEGVYLRISAAKNAVGSPVWHTATVALPEAAV